jgi:uncharacterized membrane protein YecN with MAPEG domain
VSVAITLLYAGLLSLIFIALTVRVVQLRGKRQVGIGDGGHQDLALAIRVHANFVEYVPLLLVLIGFLEASGAPAWAVHAMGVVLVVCRLAHAQGLSGSEGTSPGRAVGAGGTLLLLLVGAVWAVLRGIGIG